MIGERASGRFDVGALLLRALAIGSKFLLMMYLMRYLSLADLGVYGLFATAQTLGVYLVGLEFHNHTSRRLIAVSGSARADVLGSQIRLHVVVYASIAVLYLSIRTTELVPDGRLLFWFPFVLVSSHLSQEVQRILIATSRARAAYALGAIANGLWTIPVMALGVLQPAARNLDVVFASWTLGAVASVIIGVVSLRRDGLLVWGEWGSWPEVRKGLQLCWRLFVVAASYRAIDGIDRYFLLHWWGESTVGVYTFFGGVSRLLQDFMYAGVLSVLWPGVVAAYHSQDRQAFQAARARLQRATLTSTAVFSLIFFVGIHVVLAIANEDALRAQVNSYYVLVLAKAVLCMVMIPQYALYAAGNDGAILWAVIFGLGLNVVLNALLVPASGTMGAAAAALVASLGILMAQLYAQRRMEAANGC